MERCAKITTDYNGKEQIVRCCVFCSRPNRIGNNIYVVCNWKGSNHKIATKNKITCPNHQSIQNTKGDLSE